MSTQIIYLHGTCKWAKLETPDEKYGHWTLDLYPDQESLAKVKKSGLELKERTDNEGKGPFIKLRRKKQKLIKDALVKFDPPSILNSDNKPMPQDTKIGNGSTVFCKVEVYDTIKGKGHTLAAVRIENLIEYNPNQTIVDKDIDLPF
jgi:hypothetical protein